MLEKAQKYTGKVEDALGVALDKVQEEAPATVSQYLWWHACYNAFVVLSLSAATVYGVRTVGPAVAAADKADDDGDLGPFVSSLTKAVLSGLIGVIGIAGMFISGIGALLNVIQIIVAPRIFLLERISELVK